MVCVPLEGNVARNLETANNCFVLLSKLLTITASAIKDVQLEDVRSSFKRLFSSVCVRLLTLSTHIRVDLEPQIALTMVYIKLSCKQMSVG